MKRLAFIPARGGSKRIPRKNIKDFLGKPIIAYSITAALESGIFDEVMVSTEDEEIAEIARQYGASVPFMRSQEAAADTAVDKDVIFEVLHEYEKRGQTFDIIVRIYPCAPFVTPQKLRDIVKKLEENDIGAVSPVCKFSSPPQRGVVLRDGRLEYLMPEFVACRSQDLEPVYHSCGQYSAMRVKNYLEDPYNCSRIPLIVPEEEFQDVDTEADWRMAEVKYKAFVLGEK